jgi:hemoglobin
MARVEQLEGSESDGAGDAMSDGVAGEQAAPRDQDKLTLFTRLGGEAGMTEIVADFISRVLEDPRVNWQRLGVQRGLFRQNAATRWVATPENVTRLEKHMVQFLSLATGGPPRYDGKDLKDSHATLRITNAEFDAVIGDLKASLDRLKIRSREQKELLAIVESTRPQIVTER